MGCPRSATSYSAGAAAGSRSPEEAPVDPSPAPVDRGGPRALARRPDLALAGGGRRVRPDMLQGSAVMTSGELAIVIAGTHEDWSGGAMTLTRARVHPNGTLSFGAELDPDGGGRMPAATPADRGRRLVDALMVWIHAGTASSSPASTVSKVRISGAGDGWIERLG